MQNIIHRNWRPHDLLFAFLVLAFLLVFTTGILYLCPYPGFYFNPTDGTVITIYKDLTPISALHLMSGDVLKRVGSISFEEYSNSATVNFFEKYQPGQTVELLVMRNGKSLTIPWVYTGLNGAEFSARLFNTWWLAYIFWLVGMATQLFMRPKDRRWGLFVAFNYLTGMFIMLGNSSSFQFLASSSLLRVVAWLLLPVYLHFHWIFPRSLYHLPRWLKITFYASCGLMALSELFLPIPKTLYFLAVLLAFGGSIVLLILHYIFQSEHRGELSILAIAAFFALGFTVVAGIVASSGHTPPGAVLSILALPILPGTYFYVLYRHSLGGLELRTNRAISMYLFIILLGIILLLTFGLLKTTYEATAFADILITLFTVFISILVFPTFQALVERRLLGIKLPSQSLAENFSARIVTSDTQAELFKLLREEVFPSLLIRQYAFVRNLKSSGQVMLSENVTQAQVRTEALLDLFASLKTSSLLPSSKLDPPFEWVQLSLPLRFGAEIIGVWLLGRRDPDDRYPQAEIPVLQSLANQTAIAVSNILQMEQVREMYEANILRHEQERASLGRDLHDSVLNELAALLMSSEAPVFSPKFKDEYDEVSKRLREIVSDLRPPLLNYGLKMALEGLADNLMERNQNLTQITANLVEQGECRYGETVEINLYRITQEACQNSLRYARAKSIQIIGTLSPEAIDLAVEDDGLGFAQEIGLKLNELIAHKHFGLANMLERAHVIGAEIKIDSQPEHGTKVHAVWSKK